MAKARRCTHCLFGVTVFFIAANIAANALADVRYLELASGQERYATGTFVDYYRDPGGELSIDDIDSMSFADLPTEVADFGYTSDKFWLRLGVRNPADASASWLLRTYMRFMRPLDIFFVTDHGVEKLLDNDEFDRFGTRPEGIRHLATEFRLPARTDGIIYIRFGAGGRATLPFEIETKRAAAAEQAQAELASGLFVAVLATLTLFNLFHYFAVRALAYLFYGFQAIAFALYVTHMEGFTFQYLWPNSPSWNATGSPFLGALCQFTGLLFSIAFLRSRQYTPRYYRWLLAFLAIIGTNLVMSLVVSTRITNQIGLLISLLIPALLVPHAIYVVRRGHVAARYYLLGWTAMLLGVAVFAMQMLGVVGALAISSMDIVKIVILIEALSLAFGLADQHRRVNLNYAETQRQLVHSLEERLNEARERIQLEHERERTMLTMLQRSRQLASTSHDINQPIQSLRLALKALGSRIDDPLMVERLDTTLDHMGDVLKSALNETRDQESPTVAIAVGELLHDVATSLDEEATSKGVTIRIFDSALVFTCSRLPIKRCLMNLLSNALEHSQGAVLLGARRRGDRIILQVIDNGRGIAKDRLADLTSPFVRGEASGGYGLGLAIVKEICTEYDWQFDIVTAIGKGSTFSLGIPRSANE